MFDSKLFYMQAIVLLVVAALHFVGLAHYLYWYFGWFDVLMHLLGGMWVVLASAWLWTWWRGEQERFSPAQALFAVLAVGIGWEVFEVVGGISPEDNYWFDTSLDLLMDTIGGMIAWLFARIIIRHEQ